MSTSSGVPPTHTVFVELSRDNPYEFRKAYIPHITVVGLASPRLPKGSLTALLGDPLSQRPGTYILVDDANTAYIGSSENVALRLKQHISRKEFWTSVYVLVSSQDGGLNIAHSKYLESRLIRKAQDVGRCTLNNGNTPSVNMLGAYDTQIAESFLSTAMLIIPTLGVRIFQPVERTSPAPVPSRAPAPTTTLSQVQTTGGTTHGTVFVTHRKGVSAKGVLEADGKRFRVLKGSGLHPASNGSASCKTYEDFQTRLLVEGAVVRDTVTGEMTFVADYVFRTPSSAAGTVHGVSKNGYTSWKDVNGNTLGQVMGRQT